MDRRELVDTPIKRGDLPRAFGVAVKSTCLVINKVNHATGTGFVVAGPTAQKNHGIVGTAAHVLAIDKNKYAKNVVCLFGGEAFETELVYVDKKYDIALVRYEGPEPFKPNMELYYPDEASIGIDVASLSYPGVNIKRNFSGEEVNVQGYLTLTRGIISSIIPPEMTGGAKIYQLDLMGLEGSSGAPVFAYPEAYPLVIGIMVQSIRFFDEVEKVEKVIDSHPLSSPKVIVEEFEKGSGFVYRHITNLSLAVNIAYLSDAFETLGVKRVGD